MQLYIYVAEGHVEPLHFTTHRVHVDQILQLYYRVNRRLLTKKKREDEKVSRACKGASCIEAHR